MCHVGIHAKFSGYIREALAERVRMHNAEKIKASGTDSKCYQSTGE